MTTSTLVFVSAHTRRKPQKRTSNNLLKRVFVWLAVRIGFFGFLFIWYFLSH